MNQAWHSLTAEETATRLDVDLRQGLSETEAGNRLASFGPNEIPATGMRPPWRIFAGQFSGMLVQILIAAAAFALTIGEILEAGVILALVLLNSVLGFLQEARAERALVALRRMAIGQATVQRGGRICEIPADRLVPGDIVLLQTGDGIPADGRLLESIDLSVQESALTGESAPVRKDADAVLEPATALADRTNRVHLGTQVVYGRGSFIVTETGASTALGATARLLESVTAEPTPLQKQLDGLARMLAYGVAGVAVVVLLLGIAGGESFRTMILTAVSLAVAAVPESLTALVAITLAVGAQKMLGQGALIRRLPAVEALGSIEVICADKTGTMTENRMTVSVLDVAEHRLELKLAEPDSGGLAAEIAGHPAIDLLLIGGALCNDGLLENPEDPHGAYRVRGEPTEAALVLAAARGGRLKTALEATLPRIAEIPFDAGRRLMTTVHGPVATDGVGPGVVGRYLDGGRYLVLTKGAVEALLPRADTIWVDGDERVLDAAWRERITRAHDALAEKGMRVLAVGMRRLATLPDKDARAALENGLSFIGLIGIYDPPRPAVTHAIAECRQAGIKAVMITGDHPLTARHIAEEVGIDTAAGVIGGSEIAAMTPAELRETVKRATVFARVAPEDKLRLIEAYQSEGWSVAMTGDGVNDAPALKKADIGIAMGRMGTDVAKEAAQIVLLDDNFATITAAVRQGRAIYDNLIKFIVYLLSCNVSEIAVVTFAPFLGMPLPLLPLQILWMNLVTDGLPALALGMEPAEDDLMERPSQTAGELIFGKQGLYLMLLVGALITELSLGIGFAYWLGGSAAWQTMLLTVLVFSQMAVALALRSRSRPTVQLGWGSNPALLGAVAATVLLQLAIVYLPPLQTAFQTTALSLGDLAVAGASAVAVFLGTERIKLAGFLRQG
ncbi:cation-transporting ATPase, E1-E2 family [Methylococcus capsulatus str. Bath]|uniref:Cation-transporting ATPase, E1-E2 family n=1 Tax=Methylococcus capsulatus (strain ATCC 33009 / NCIMB 11132 / Bath) TaxID=243233 RepID=Q60A66_METCA|nr:cation-translocating P-type ATPase [Methylococcus capsulatus]AAU92928.1 cation-transporting ATPase, E1-E2 family [Methylococcus capsulatus str. Bath]